MSPQNYAAVLHGPFDVRVEKWPMPEIKDDEVLVRMECVGVCGSDVKMYTTGKCGFDAITEPFALGHEGSGVVAQVGSKVTTLQVGDRVAVEPTRPCRACTECKLGRYNLCADARYCSYKGTDGNLCRYYAHVADFCHKVPDKLSLQEAAAVQPLAIAVHACARADVRLGARVAVLGAGPVGVLCALTARAMGATDVLVTDVLSSRLETAKQLGVDHTLEVSKDLTEEQTVEKVIQLLGDRPDIVIDACGFASAQRVAMKVARSGGVVVVVGIGDQSVEVPLTPTLLREVDVRGSYRFANRYPAALAAASCGSIDLKSFITHQLPLAKTQQGLELCRKGEGMKVIINVQE